MCMPLFNNNNLKGNNGVMDGDLRSESPYAKSSPQPIGRPERVERPPSTLENFQRAPGAEVKSRSFEDDSQVSSCLQTSVC